MRRSPAESAKVRQNERQHPESLGTALAELYPTAVRYTGASLSLNLAGIVGASLAPYAATWLAMRYGLASVGYYLSAAALVSLIAFALIAREGGRADSTSPASMPSS